jgi:hypothetical protein
MGITFILILSTLFSAPKGLAADCAACKANDALAQEFSRLHPANEDEHFQGEQKAETAMEKIEAFAKVAAKDANRNAQFKSLLGLAREAMPFDGEGRVADVLAGFLRKPDLKKEYGKWLGTVAKATKADTCKTKLLENRVEEKLCLEKAGVKGQDTKGKKFPEACIKPFNYETCLAEK